MAMTTHTELMAGYLLANKRRGFSPRSSKARTASARLLAAYIRPRSLLEATRADIEEWLDSRAMGAATRRWHLSNLKAFYLWASEEDHIEADPTARIRGPKIRRRLPRPIGEEDLGVALSMADPRMRCILLLAAFAGLRCKEIAGLRRQDILDRATPPLLVVADGKGGHQRQVPLHPELWAALRAYGLPKRGWVFPGVNGPLKPHTISRCVSVYLHGLGIDATSHQGRHRFATSVYQASKDLRLTQELMGHVSPATTALYAAWDEDQATSVVGRISVGWKAREALL